MSVYGRGVVWAGVCGLMLALAGGEARAAVVAYWRFEPDNFLADSSGNGHNLANGGGSLDAASSADVAGAEGGAGSAYFDGSAVLSTLAALDLTGYTQLRFTWYQRHQATSGVRVVFEHSSNFNSFYGAFLTAVNSDLGGSNPATQGYMAMTGPTRNADLYPQTTAATPGTWQKLVAEVDVAAANVNDRIRIFDGDGNEIGTNHQSGTGWTSFINDTLFIGARGTGAAIGFVGNIDELKIEEIPEPATATLLALGAAGLLRRRRGGR